MDWETIYKNNSKKMLGIAKRYIPDNAMAEDIVQDSFITAMQKAEQYNILKGSIYAWMSKIVINKCLNYIRDSRTITLNYELNDTETTEMSIFQNQLFEYDFSQEELLTFINKLPQIQKVVFNLYVIDKFSHEKISEQLNIPINTSKSHLSRARKKLQEIIIEEANYKKKKKRNYAAIFMCIITFSSPINYIFAQKLKIIKSLPLKQFDVTSAISKYGITTTGLKQAAIYSILKTKILITTIGILSLSSIVYIAFKKKSIKNQQKIENIKKLDTIKNIETTINKKDTTKKIKIVKKSENTLTNKKIEKQDTIRETIIIHKKEIDTIHVVQ